MSDKTIRYGDGWQTTVTEQIELDNATLPELISSLTDILARSSAAVGTADNNGPWLWVTTEQDYDFNRHSLEVSWVRVTTDEDIRLAELAAEREVSARRTALEEQLRRLNGGV